jgi:hypothetical protein
MLCIVHLFLVFMQLSFRIKPFIEGLTVVKTSDSGISGTLANSGGIDIDQQQPESKR